jgi:apolipoprotein N-acyltransferase
VLVFSFPRFGHPAFAWIALAPLLVALGRRLTLGRSFLLGVTTGLVYFAGTLYWITHVMVVYGGLPTAVAVPVNAALVAYLAIYPAIFAVVVGRGVRAFGVTALMAAPFVWVATELGRAYFFTGFPWVLVGYSQVDALPIAQLASVVGVYGVSALVVAVSGAVATALLARRYLPLVAMAALVALVAVWGAARVRGGDLTRTGEPVRVGLVQGNVDQAIKWNPARASMIFEEYLRLTRRALDQKATLILWPESSTPFMFEEDRADADRIRALVRDARVPLLLGSDQVEHVRPPRYFNSAFLVSPDGNIAGVYRKLHLVPFGEFVPRAFFFASRLVEAVSDFSAGDAAVLLAARGHLISTAICYEIVYPDLVRRFVAGGSELLTTITNDAWFGETSAPYQHFEQAVMRAIENGRYLVRAANTGISGIVDPYGHVLVTSRLYQEAVIVGDARFLRERTVYTRIGDAFAYASAAITAALLLFALKRR